MSSDACMSLSHFDSALSFFKFLYFKKINFQNHESKQIIINQNKKNINHHFKIRSKY